MWLAAREQSERSFDVFIPVKNDTGAVAPLEHLPAAAGSYMAGQILTMTAGKLAALAAALPGMPQYLCMTSGTVEDETLIAVTRVNAGTIYETVLGEDISEGAGTMVGVLSDGLRAGGAGCFEIVSAEGLEEGSRIRGRFVPGAGSAAGTACAAGNGCPLEDDENKEDEGV